MRTTKKYTFKETLAILTQYWVSRISLFYFKRISKRKITLIRKQGIGDHIFSTGVLYRFMELHPQTEVNVVVAHAEVYDFKTKDKFSILDFPLVWVMYEHYDFSFLRKEDKRIPKIMADFLGLPQNLDYAYQLPSQAINEIDTSKPYMVIQPQAGGWNSDRNWQQERWNKLLSLLKNEDIPVFQIGVETDPLVEGSVDFRGRLSLKQSFELIKQARLFVGVNSFGEQAASAFNIPSLILYGPTNPLYSLNVNQSAIFANKAMSFEEVADLDYDFPATTEIDVDLVRNQILKLWRAQKPGDL